MFAVFNLPLASVHTHHTVLPFQDVLIKTRLTLNLVLDSSASLSCFLGKKGFPELPTNMLKMLGKFTVI